jgi:hypothetical protein
MKIEPRPSDVRRIVLEMFQQLSESPQGLLDLEERILIAEGGFAAWSYSTGKLMAMRMADVGIVQFYDPDGNMLATVNLLEELTPRQAAA